MQLINLLCLILLTINVAARPVKYENQQELAENHVDRRITKREAAILIDNFPIEPSYGKKEKVIYRRVSKQRFRGPRGLKLKYGQHSMNYRQHESKRGPPAPKYGPLPPKYSSPRVKYPLKPGRNFSKKYRGKNSAKHGRNSSRNKKRTTKPKYRPPKHSRPTYGPPSKVQYHPQPSEPIGFGEPPLDHTRDFEIPRPTSREPPVDSYGAPLKIKHDDLYPIAPGVSEAANHYDNRYHNFGQEHQPSWQPEPQHQVLDNAYAHSNSHPTHVQPAGNLLNDPIDYNEDISLDSYSDDKSKKVLKFYNNKLVNKPWKINDNKELDDQMLVGGQYAEPPARYVPKFQPSAPMYSGNEGFGPPKTFADFDVVSASSSPYVNYKNSNLAFSPQNLNDVFSIV